MSRKRWNRCLQQNQKKKGLEWDFLFMEAFMDQVEVISKQGEGTTVIMTKKIGDQDKLNG